MTNRPKIGVTLGDVAGIGPEINDLVRVVLQERKMIVAVVFIISLNLYLLILFSFFHILKSHILIFYFEFSS